MSNDALSIAAAGMRSEQTEVDRISNDLANMNTPNYKKTTVSFEDAMYRPVQANQISQNQPQAQIGQGSVIYKTSKDFTPGEIKITNNPQNIAINGDGFFEVILNDGTYAYTRSSDIHPDGEGFLQTGDGHRLSSNIQIPSDALAYRILNNGEVYAQLPNQKDPMRLGQIQLAKFLNPSDLEAIGHGLYTPSKDSGEPYSDNPGQSGLGQLEQGAIETSNVDMVEEMMSLTMAQRAYQLNAKVAQVSDELDKETNEIRG